MTRTSRALALLVVALLAGPARAVDETVAGRSLSMRQGKQTSTLRLAVRGGIVAPLPGGSEDPTLVGGSLEISNPATGEWARLDAPAAGWSMNALGTVYRFRNAARRAGPGLRLLVIRHGQRIKVKASTAGITLDEPAQGALAAALATGTRRYCVVFGGDVRRDEPGRFAARRAPAPTACPEAPAGTSTTTTTLARPGRPTTTTTRRDPTSTTTTTTRPAGPSTTSTTAQGTPSTTTSTLVRVTTSTTRVTTSTSTSSTRAPTTTSTTSQPPSSTTRPPTSSTAPPTTTSTSSTTTTTKKPKKDKGKGND